MSTFRAWVSLCGLVGFLAGSAVAVNIETVPVGNLGNTGDTRYPSGGVSSFGGVDYAYSIGKHEVTAGQYCQFLNAVAATDAYALYNTNMSRTDYGSGISRSGSSGSYTYSVDAAFVNRPVNYVSYWDACRFANWLHNGQGNGDTETGAYTLTPTGIANNTVTRNANWKWAVTSEDEWCKAAYYSPAASNYYDYPTSSNTAPGRDLADVSGNNANYYEGSGPYPIQSPYYTTVAGEFQNSESPYGTFDQGGNVWEWNEALRYASYRGLRGGSFYFSVGVDLRASLGRVDDPSFEDFGVGFRVSEVPEPATLLLLVPGGLALIRSRCQ